MIGGKISGMCLWLGATFLMGCDSRAAFESVDLCGDTADLRIEDYVVPTGFVALELNDSCVLGSVGKVI